MGRPIRMFSPEQVYFVTQRCFQARLLMTPRKEVVNTIGGIVAMATHKYPEIQLHDAVFASNHYHLILSAKERGMIPRFMGWLSREISVRVGRLVGWRGAFFERRYDAAPVLDDEALVDRIAYLRKHGVKEGLVSSPLEWPGLTLIPELHHDRRRVFPFESRSTNSTEFLPIRVAAPVGWEEIAPEELRRRFVKISEDATEEATLESEGKPCCGAARVVEQDPHSTPHCIARSPRKRCFASRLEKHQEYWEAYKAFVEHLRARYDNLLDAWRKMGTDGLSLPGFGFCSCIT